MSVFCECCVLSGRGLCDGLITCPEESYRPWCVVVCDLETSLMTWPCPIEGCCAMVNIYIYIYYILVMSLCLLSAVQNTLCLGRQFRYFY